MYARKVCDGSRPINLKKYYERIKYAPHLQRNFCRNRKTIKTEKSNLGQKNIPDNVAPFVVCGCKLYSKFNL
jgi:hypothetical protein